MIKLNMSGESFCDLHTGNLLGSIECVEGLPRNVTLISVSLLNGVLEYIFDDGKPETSHSSLMFIKNTKKED